jgi:hypothetical protein
MTCQTLMIEKVPVGPTRYRDVVLTSWDRGMSDREHKTHPLPAGGCPCATKIMTCERLRTGPTRYRDVVLTSWDCGGETDRLICCDEFRDSILTVSTSPGNSDSGEFAALKLAIHPR